MNSRSHRYLILLMIGLNFSAVSDVVSDGISSSVKRGRDYLNRNEFNRVWFSYSDTDKESVSPWKLVDQMEGTAPAEQQASPILVCSGKPDGYLRTTEIMEEYSLSLEWRYPRDTHGNSGILLHVSDQDKVWPESVQVQLHTPTVGSVFPTSGASTKSILHPPADLKVNPQEWNRCQILSAGGNLRVSFNDLWVGSVEGCEPRRGHIALQSEGSEVHFRNIEIRSLSDEERRSIVKSEAPQARKARRTRRRT